MEEGKRGFDPGHGETLDAAMRDAYNRAEKHEREHRREREGGPAYVVERIELHGTNPFTEYKVFLIPGG